MSTYLSKRKKTRSIRRPKKKSKARSKSRKKSIRRLSKSRSRKKSIRKSSKSRSRIRKRSKSRSRKKSTRKRSKSKRNDGAGRFSIKSKSNINETILKQLKDIDKYAKLKYNYDIDFTKEKEFRNLEKEHNLSFLKIKLNEYIQLVKNSLLYPKMQLNDFKQNYLKKLLKIQDEIDDILYLPTHIKKIKKSPQRPLPTG